MKRMTDLRVYYHPLSGGGTWDPTPKMNMCLFTCSIPVRAFLPPQDDQKCPETAKRLPTIAGKLPTITKNGWKITNNDKQWLENDKKLRVNLKQKTKNGCKNQ